MFASEKNDDYFLLTIEYEKALMESVIKDLWSKFKNIVLPEILTRKDDAMANDRKLYCMCQRPVFGNMIACENSTCKIEWLPHPCANITRAPKKQWFCEECRKK